MTKKADKAGRYRVQFDFTYGGTKGKEMDDEIVTQPDMTLTVRQLLEHHTRGIDTGITPKEPFYFDIEVPTITDITDIQRYREHLQEKIRQTDEYITRDKKAQAEEKAKAKQKTLDEEIEKLENK